MAEARELTIENLWRAVDAMQEVARADGEPLVVPRDKIFHLIRRDAVRTRDGEGGHAQRDGVADEGEGAL